MKSWESRVGAVLSALRLDSIKNKIVVLALLATLIPAVGTALLSYAQNRRAITASLEEELRNVGSQNARELDLWIKERSYDVRVFVGSFEVSENLERTLQGGSVRVGALARLSDYLTGVQGRFGDYSELLVSDPVGQPVASTASSLRAVAFPPEWLPRLRQGDVVLGNPYVDSATADVAALVAVPIQSPGGRFLGALTATLTFEPVRRLLTLREPGESGWVMLVTGDGHLIVASNSIAPPLDPSLPEGGAAELAAASPGPVEYVAPGRGLVVANWTPVPSHDWAVIAAIPRVEAYAQSAQLRNTTLSLVTVLLIAVGAIAYLLGLFIVRPLGRLTEGAGAVAGGDLSVDLPVTGRGEVGYLTAVFNEMVGRLRRSREELDEANAALREQNQELERISITDGLTGLYNRRYVMGAFDREIQRAVRHGRKLGVLMLDVDRFKQYNDTHGHPAGDVVLAGMGRVLTAATREPDVPARYGGEEFIVLLAECNLQGAINAGERIRARLRDEVFEGGAVTASIGAAEVPTHGETLAEVIAAADAALYEAKRRGRDQVVAAAVPHAPAQSSATTGPARRKAGGRKKNAGPDEADTAKKTDEGDP